MDKQESQVWVRFIEALVRLHNADDATRRNLLERFSAQFLLMAFWLNCLKVTGGESIEAQGFPNVCDLCGAEFKSQGLFVDGMIKDGRWSYMCMSCFGHHGLGIGWGVGQLFRVNGHDVEGDVKWVCIAGGPPVQNSCED